MIASTMVMSTSASSAYQTYTYAIGGYALYSPDAYTADNDVIDSKYMGLETPLSNPNDLITDKEGNAYIENTMDVFVQMKDGNKYYSSNSLVSPTMNIYRLG